ncbi:hypothetical protein CcaverHIS002_0509920 [Cutaneotrichosporon cavernicola]|uniref:Uncharacterized protein n=1 Tax=Cutaneotrichosporon cavernicola TaxID=279322 RepID=A0AA48QXJ6_9TREE|nr:uncharacterized protein CcaverHIS019_0510480 [Cutaneotrichosporon cavernicola]BEI85591.1 hypothetical protein CcaverHIS002_0509920 [Cutaneotrichosporon cavernicola]BEI93420.1 hypothetical protein CcaverHIS019_0510480 [Cutaneotrichosporon cavernicola]BEJ01198.1 hypothetical protein CcaverHIS631_0510550 [Cutaneotrichosporon cavernicola]BEJ08966.1 hypothetical protein CcaverHIS641_0510600 [Cutaneotrichosporon cavernicola]
MPSTPDTSVRDLYDYDSLAEKGYSDGGDSPASTPHLGKGEFNASVSAQNAGRAIAARAARTARRGNLPFLIIFLIALFVFFGALAGVGYVDPEAASVIPENEFIVGGPVFDASEGQLRELQIQEQREREQHWLKKQRPNAGAWMHKHREDGAVRLRPGQKAEAWFGDQAHVDGHH